MTPVTSCYRVNYGADSSGRAGFAANRTCFDYKKNIQENKQIQNQNPMSRLFWRSSLSGGQWRVEWHSCSYLAGSGRSYPCKPGRVFPWFSILIGGFVGLGVQRFGRGLDWRFPVIAAVLAWVGAYVGNLMIGIVETGRYIEADFVQCICRTVAGHDGEFFRQYCQSG